MRSRAFTLIELLVAVGAIALLIALILPELSAARSLARSAMCKSNLRQIGAGLQAAAGRVVSANGATMQYPRPGDYPAVPFNFLPNERVFICPEDDPDWDMAPNIWWICKSTGVRSNWVDGLTWNGWTSCRSRRGRDESGDYTEYVFEDVLPYSAHDSGPLGCNFTENQPWFPAHGYDPNWSNNDSVFRLYDLVGEQSGKRLLKLQEAPCTMENYAYLLDEPLFGQDIKLHNFEGQFTWLDALYTSYGINAKTHRHRVAPDTVVLLDYEQIEDDASFVANPDGDNINDRLNVSGRHLGRINILTSDQSVRHVWPTELDPAIDYGAWSPELGAGK